MWDSLRYSGCMTRTQPRDEAFIMTRVAMVESGCWEWRKFVNPVTGYGHTSRIGSRVPVGAHVLSYEIFKGPIPSGLVIDHTCNNRRCVNPHHLDAVTDAENNRRMAERGRCANQNTSKNCCPQCGGPYETLFRPARPKGFRRCRPCHQAQQNRYERAQRAAKRGDP